MSTFQISEGMEVTLNFAIKMSDGKLVDSNFDTKPATFTVGDGNLLVGFEEVLMGLTAGDEGSYT